MRTRAGAGWLLALAAAPAGAVALDTLPLIDEPPAAGVRWQVELGHDFTRALGRLAGSEREAADQIGRAHV